MTDARATGRLVLDCEDRTSALTSCAAIVGLAPEVLLSRLRRIPDDDLFGGVSAEAIGLAELPTPEAVSYFHVSRAATLDGYQSDGLLPRSTAEARVWKVLEDVCGLLVSSEQWAFIRSHTTSLSENYANQAAYPDLNEGPFGFLVFEQINEQEHAFPARGAELLRDICDAVEQHTGVDALAMFLAESRPVVVKFLGPGDPHALRDALKYVAQSDGKPPGDVGIYTCFAGGAATETVSVRWLEQLRR